MEIYEGKEDYIFVSYAHAERSKVEPIIEALCNSGLRIWYDPGIKVGSEWAKTIAEHVEKCKVFMFFASPVSVTRENCLDEIELARDEEKNIITVYLEETTLPSELKLRINRKQHLFRYYFKTESEFLQELCQAPILDSCRMMVDKMSKHYEIETCNSMQATEDELSLQEKAKSGDAETQFRLGYCYSYGDKTRGIAKDSQKAMEWYKKAAEQGHAGAQVNLGTYYYGEGVDQDYKEAVMWYKKAAEQGNARAQYNLGLCYYYGNGVDQDYKEALTWYKKAADQGYANAQAKFGNSYYYGEGVDQDYKEAVMWYKKAADQGHTGAQADLGSCYRWGHGVYPSSTEALRWFKLAAEAGDSSAQYELGDMYRIGWWGTPKNIEEAVRLYKLSAVQGDPRAQYELGCLYEFGDGVEENEEEAVRLYKLSAEAGYDDAQYSLGLCYKDGIGIEKNIELAIKWFKKAADQDNEDAQEELEKLES